MHNAGDIVGVNSFKGEGEGLNFAVSSNAASALLNSSGNRTVQHVGTTPPTANKKCGPKPVKTWRMSDPPGVATSYDLNCTNVVDMIAETPATRSMTRPDPESPI